MSRAATGGELTYLRTPGQWSRLWLAVYKPNVIYTALLNGVPTSNDLVGQISFDGGSGTLADVKAEMTLWVGSTAGARDLGICRIRKAPISGTFYVGLTSEIEWADNCYLTVVDLAMPFAKPARMDSGTLKIDYDVSYSSQNEDFSPVVRMGPHAVVWLTGSTVDVEFSATAFVPGSTISTYSWSAPGSSATSGTSTATPTITYNAAGMYRVYCTVTAANGKTFEGVRHVMVFDADNIPKRVELTSDPSEPYENGGWEFAVKMYADAETDEVVEGTLCILFGEDRFGSTLTSIGAVENRENIICMGYVDGETIEWDAEISTVEFAVHGMQWWMDQIELNPVRLEMASNTPADWNTVAELTVDRALHHLLVWRSNIAAIMDVTLTSDTRYAPYIEADEGSLWSQLSQIAYQKIFARGGVDRYGRLFVEIDPQMVPEADRTWATVMTITKKDYEQRVNVQRKKIRPLGLLSTSGWRTQNGGQTNTLYSLSMGHIHARTGRSEMIDKLLASSQTQFNTLTGLYFAWQNAELEFEFSMPQNNRIIDLFPRQFLDISLAADDTPRGIAYAGNLIPRSLTLRYDAESSSFSLDLVCEPETFPALAMNGDIPPASGVNDWDDSNFPDVGMPGFGDIGEIITLPPSIENPNHPKKVIIGTSKGIFYTLDFDADIPTWQAMNNGLETADITASYRNMHVTPGGGIWMLSGLARDNNLYYASSLGGTWELIANADELAVSLGNHSSGNPYVTGVILALGVNTNESNEIAFSFYALTAGGAATARIGFANPTVALAGEWTNSLVETAQSLIYHEGEWRLFYAAPALSMRKFTGGGSAGTLHTIDALALSGHASAIRRADEYVVWTWDVGGTPGFWLVDDSGAVTGINTFAPLGISNQSMAFSPTGVYGMGTGLSPFTPYLSTDSGASWSSISGTVPVGPNVWDNCKDDNRFIFGGGTVLRLTVDRGTSYVDKDGNLDYIAPLMNVQSIRFIA